MSMYATVDDLKVYLRIPDTDTVDDVDLERALTVASSEITHLCDRSFDTPEADAVTRYYQPAYDRQLLQWTVPIDDLQTTTSLAVKTYNTTTADWDVTVDVADVLLRPVGDGTATPWRTLILPAGVADFPCNGANASYVQVTAKFGWTAVPDPVAQATLILASRVFKVRDSPFGIISSPDGSENTRLLNTVDPTMYAALRGYIKYWGAR